MDDDMDSQPVTTSRAPRAGRRAAQDGTAEEAAGPPRGGWGEDDAGGGGGGGDGPSRPSRRRAEGAAGGGGGGGGWTDTTTTDVSDNIPSADAKPSTTSTRRVDEGEGGVIAVIPDLDEDEDITTQVANAPRAVNRALQSLNELSSGPQMSVPSGQQAPGLDLSLLTSALSPADALQEDDEPWDFDHLLQSVAQEIQKDIDVAEPEDASAAD